MKKIKQFANNAFRPDRTEVLTQSLQEAERRIDQIKVTCESLAKKVHDCLQGRGKDVGIDKRIRKVPEFMLGSAMITNGKNLGDGSILGEVLAESGQIEMKLGQAVVEYEVKIEENILKPLQHLMENDLPSIYKLKRQLAKYTTDMDIAKGKLTQANRHSMSVGQGNKADSIREEYDEALGKVEQCRDNLAAEMYALIARESEISKLIVDFLNAQKDYHSSVYSILSELISNVDSCVASSIHKPVYGQDLEEHLRSSGRSIAYPIELCVCGLLETALEEEGLFRIAGSTSKVKKLKSAFDATLMDLEGLLGEFCDVHVIANALKCYLRELPEPLLTFGLYGEWMNAIRIPDPTLRQEALWVVLKKLPLPHYNNLRYLVKFLKELSSHQDVNKMSPANIAIVIAPNLLWSQPPPPTQSSSGGAGGDDIGGVDSQMGLNMTMTHLYSSVLEQLVSNCNYFFPEDLDFFVTCVKPRPLPIEPDHSHHNHHRNTKGLSNGSSFQEESLSSSEEKALGLKRSTSNSSMNSNDDCQSSPPQGGSSPKPILRRKNKPAPTPPTTQNYQQKINNNNKNPLANMKPFSGTYPVSPVGKGVSQSQQVSGGGTATSLSNASKEKREGVWIPPSPKDTQRRRFDNNVNNVPPVKPPPPNLDSSPFSAKQKFLGDQPPPSKPESSLRHKSSFKGSAPDGKNKSGSGGSNTTDNIGSSGGTSTSSTFGSNAANFASLPRHFHTENSYKTKAGPPARPPSMYGIPPPAPPTTIEKEKVGVTPVPEYQAPAVGASTIGFEKVEEEVRKENVSSGDGGDEVTTVEGVKVKGEDPPPDSGASLPFPRPIPAPRSSLLVQSQSFKEVGSTPNSGPESAPSVKERPSIMAKPRDLSRRNLSNNSTSSQSEIDHICSSTTTTPSQNLLPHQHSHENSSTATPSAVSSSDQENKSKPPPPLESDAFCKNNGISSKSATNSVQQQPSPTGKTAPSSFLNKPPRPQPPAPPSNSSNNIIINNNNNLHKVKASHESTDL